MRLYLFPAADGQHEPLFDGLPLWEGSANLNEAQITRVKAGAGQAGAPHLVDTTHQYTRPVATVEGGRIVAVAEAPAPPYDHAAAVAAAAQRMVAQIDAIVEGRKAGYLTGEIDLWPDMRREAVAVDLAVKTGQPLPEAPTLAMQCQPGETVPERAAKVLANVALVAEAIKGKEIFYYQLRATTDQAELEIAVATIDGLLPVLAAAQTAQEIQDLMAGGL